MNSSGTEFEALIKDLQEGNEQERRYAAEDLGYGKYQAAIPELIKSLSDPSIAVSEACSSALIRIGGETVARQIAPSLETEDVRLRNYIVEILSLIGEVSIPILWEQLKNGGRDVRIFSVDILTKIGSSRCVEILLDALDDEDVNVASTAADGLGDIAGAEHIPVLLQHMDTEAWMRCSILRGISKIGGTAALEAVLPYTEDEDMLVKFSAIKALGKIGREDALPRLLEIMQYDDLSIYGGETVSAVIKIIDRVPDCDLASYVHEMNTAPLLELAGSGSTQEKVGALRLLGNSDNSELVEALVGFFADKNEAVHDAAVAAVLQLDPADLTPLVEILKRDDSTIPQKRAALECIGHSSSRENFTVITRFLNSTDPIIQKDTLDAIHADFEPVPRDEIIFLLEQGEKMVKISAAQAMKRLGCPEFIQPLVQQLADSDKEVRDAIDHALIYLGKINASPLIQPYLKSFSSAERLMAFEFFGLHHPETIVDQFIAGVRDSNPEIRVIAFKVLSNLRRVTLEMIEKGLQDRDENVRVQAARAFDVFAEKPEIVERMIETLQETRCERVKVELIQLLGRLATSDNVEFLTQFLDDPSPWVQLETVEALKALGDSSVVESLKKLLDSESIDLVEAVETAISELDYRL